MFYKLDRVCKFISLTSLFFLHNLYASDHTCLSPKIIHPEEASKIEIPRQLFQTWKTHELTGHFAYWSQTWKNHHPHWSFELWDDAENRQFIAQYYPWFLEKYDAYPKEIYRVDAIRYFYLYTFGGVYADLDFECLKSIEPLLNEQSVILGRMSINDHEHSIPNALMISPPKADFWLLVIYYMLEEIEGGPEKMTGPVVLRKSVIAYQDENLRKEIIEEMKSYMPDAICVPLQVRPPCELYPLDWTLGGRYEIFPCSYAITWWTHTWE